MSYLRARRNSEKDQRRQAILDAAKDLFATQGMDTTTIDQIAKACRLSRSLIYTYFLDKNHIFLAIVSAALQVMLDAFKDAIHNEKNGLDRITAIGWAYVSFALTKPEYYDATLRFQLLNPVGPSVSEKEKSELSERFQTDFQVTLKHAAQITQLMAAQVEAGVQDGSIRKDIGEPVKTALSLWAMTGGLIQTSAANAHLFSQAYDVSQKELIAQGMALMHEGLKNKGETR